MAQQNAQLAEQLSAKGVPSLLMDIKGDLSGLAKPGSMNKHIEKRQQTKAYRFLEVGNTRAMESTPIYTRGKRLQGRL